MSHPRNLQSRRWLKAAEKTLQNAFHAAISASMPDDAMAPLLSDLQNTPSAILAIGKASGPMARACRKHGLKAGGMIITHDPQVDIDGFDIFIGGHPVPNQASLDAARAAMDFVRSLTAKDHLLVLLSGGGSALMTLPGEGLSLADKMWVHQELLNSGMDIHNMNAIRRLISGVKGGRLARLTMPAKTTQWVMSDVFSTGDPDCDLAAIASGPFVADPIDLEETLSLIEKSGLWKNDTLKTYLESIIDNPEGGPVRRGDLAVADVETSIIASNVIARKAAESYLKKDDIVLPDLEGDATLMGERLAEIVMDQHAPFTAVTGGETVVALDSSHGQGGRSQELALSFLVTMSRYHSNGRDIPNFVLLAAGTDGRDGPTDAAGAIVTNAMIADHEALAEFNHALQHHDSYPVLDRLGALIKIPPTGTNLGDLVILKTTKTH